MSSNPVDPNSLPAQSIPDGGSIQPDELLPPVEPPNAGFLLQLFVVPAVIVLFVVMVWLLVTTLATRGQQDPQHIVTALRSSNQSRWQKAKELADMLRIEARYPELKQNTDLATQLAQLLDEEIDAAGEDDNSVELRYFLCRVLGEFRVDNGLAVLLKAASKDVERDVRREAINALAVLAHSFHSMDPPGRLEHPDLVATLIQLANEQDDLIRSQVAYALGVFTLGDDSDKSLVAELEKLADDLYPDARFNAALALARQGNLRAVEAVVEMFDRDATTISVSREPSPALQTYKRNTILRNALDAAQALLEKNPDIRLPELTDAIRRFVETASDWKDLGEIPEPLLAKARELLQDHADAE